jgi:hypothetical protein
MIELDFFARAPQRQDGRGMDDQQTMRAVQFNAMQSLSARGQLGHMHHRGIEQRHAGELTERQKADARATKSERRAGVSAPLVAFATGDDFEKLRALA